MSEFKKAVLFDYWRYRFVRECCTKRTLYRQI